MDALLILQNTEQNLKYHPEGNVWNHVMQVIDTAAKVKEFANHVLTMICAVFEVIKCRKVITYIRQAI